MSKATHFQLPMAMTDPAFLACIHEGFRNEQLLADFNHVHRSSLTTRDCSDMQIVSIVQAVFTDRESAVAKFVAYLHRYAYLNLPSEAIHQMRAATALVVDADSLEYPKTGPTSCR